LSGSEGRAQFIYAPLESVDVENTYLSIARSTYSIDELENPETFTFNHPGLLKCTVQIGYMCGAVDRVPAAEGFLNK
jgi:hypothetical protein